MVGEGQVYNRPTIHLQIKFPVALSGLESVYDAPGIVQVDCPCLGDTLAPVLDSLNLMKYPDNSGRN